jgi:hypothetical protein
VINRNVIPSVARDLLASPSSSARDRSTTGTSLRSGRRSEMNTSVFANARTFFARVSG